MVQPDVSNAKFLPKKLGLVLLVNTKRPKGFDAEEFCITTEEVSEWVAKDPLKKADLIILGKTESGEKSLVKKAYQAIHEAGAIWLEEPSAQLQKALLARGFEKRSSQLFQKKSKTTPEEYGQGYIDRWGDNDWLANAELEASQILAHLRPHMNKKKIKVIDVGCLNGYIMEAVRRGGVPNIFGTDISYFLAVEKNLNPSLLPGITIGDFSENDYPKVAFDVVICMEVLEHIPPELTRKFVSELARITKKDGLLLISTSEDWFADDTHINCRNRAQWYFEFARCGLVPEGDQVIFPGFNSFVVRPANGPLENLKNRIIATLKTLKAGKLKRPEGR